MIEVVAPTHEALAGGSVIALPLALGAGVIAGFNPCCLALYPAAAAACCSTENNQRERALPDSIAFALGLALAIAMLGVIAAMAGRIAAVGQPLRYAVAFVPLLMATQVLGWVRLPVPKLAGMRSSLGTFTTGFLFSLVIGPCSTPVLASVLSYAAIRGNLGFGGALLFVYGLGASVPLLCTGAVSARVAHKLDKSGYGLWVNRAIAGLLLCTGLYLLWIA